MNLKTLFLMFITLVLIVSAIPLSVSSDGIPIYKTYTTEYSMTWETRQLAHISLINSTHQKISLFLSVFSLQPESNISIIIPLRTLTSDITAASASEKEFREAMNVNIIKESASKQSWEKSTSHFISESVNATRAVGTSSLFTLVGALTVNLALNNQLTVPPSYYSIGKGLASTGGASAPIQHYVFENMVVDVYSTESSQTVRDFLIKNNLTTPTNVKNVIDNYSSQYVVVINATPQSPIPIEHFKLLKERVPNTLNEFRSYVKNYTTLTSKEIYDIAYSYEKKADLEAGGYQYETGEYMYSLVLSTYSDMPLYGYMLDLTLPLDNSTMFFPLGTGISWENPIAETKIVFEIPESKKLLLNLRTDAEAYAIGKRFYLYEYDSNNPSFDIFGTITDSSTSEKNSAFQSQYFYEISANMAYLIVIVMYFTITLIILQMFRRRLKINTPDKRDKRYKLLLFDMLFISAVLVLSIWVAIATAFCLYIYGKIGNKEMEYIKHSSFAFLGMFIFILVIVILIGMV